MLNDKEDKEDKEDRDFKILEDYCETRFSSSCMLDNIEFTDVALPVLSLEK